MEREFIEAYKELSGLVIGLLEDVLKYIGEFSDINLEKDKNIIKSVSSNVLEFSSYHENLGSYIVVYDENIAAILEDKEILVLENGERAKIDFWDYVSYEITHEKISPKLVERIEKVFEKERDLLLEEEFDNYIEISFEDLNMKVYKGKIQITVPNSKISDAEKHVRDIMEKIGSLL